LNPNKDVCRRSSNFQTPFRELSLLRCVQGVATVLITRSYCSCNVLLQGVRNSYITGL
jgi:hypothetical protein